MSSFKDPRGIPNKRPRLDNFSAPVAGNDGFKMPMAPP